MGKENKKRAKDAKAGLVAYSSSKGDSAKLPSHRDDFEDLVGDLMADALHLAAKRGQSIDLVKLALRAQDHYEHEVLEDKDPQAAAAAFNSTVPGSGAAKLAAVKAVLGQ